MKNIGVFTSGGDAPGMNACIRAVVRTAINYGLRIFGIRQGYEGMIHGEIFEMNARSVSNIIQAGGTILVTARSESFLTKKGRVTAVDNLKRFGIEGLVGIGGDGTLHGAEKLFKESDIKIVACPGTIDNDLYGTDYTIGYDTAINTALEAIDKIRDTAAAMDRLFLVEVMGRHSGFIALDVAIAGGAEGVLVPEAKGDYEKVYQVLETGIKKGKHTNIIVIAEGEEFGGANNLAKHLQEQFGIKSWVTVLGHIQRGGSPTARDRILASKLGAASVRALMDGTNGVMIGEVQSKITFTPFKLAFTKKKKLDKDELELIDILAN
ncbi:MAG: 6-phosphofructokinase [candidate division Zixibacteria bacterium CG_4_9_14_3_um_filter_46_8]|nr:MAG: 6-phosphofructokinase [candidate division Zixibacteria bacterium CG_4_9_14_3_um_filter_46_8]